MYFNEDLNRDIEKLRELRRKHQMKEFCVLRDEIRKKYKLSRTSIYRHLESSVPGVTIAKPRTTEAPNIIDDKTEDTPVNGKQEYPKTREEYEALLKKFTSIEIHRQQFTDSDVGDSLSSFFKKIFAAGVENYKQGFKVEFVTESFTITQEDINDICLIFANAYNRYNHEKLKISSTEYLRMKVRALIEQWIRTPLNQPFIRFNELEIMTRMFKRLEVRDSVPVLNFQLIQSICGELKPGISQQEIIALLTKYSPIIPSNFT